MTAAEKIRARIAELQAIHANYTAYQRDRVAEKDHHGAWDAAVNLSETECEISGLEFALKAMEVSGESPRPSVFVVPRERREGETDDSARVQDAIGEAARRGCPFYLPAGEYFIVGVKR